MLDCCCINQVFLTDFWNIIDSDSDSDSDFSSDFELIIIVIKFEHMYNKVTEQVTADKKCLYMNIFSMLQTIDAVFLIMFFIAMFLYYFVIDADKLACSFFTLKYFD